MKSSQPDSIPRMRSETSLSEVTSTIGVRRFFSPARARWLLLPKILTLLALLFVLFDPVSAVQKNESATGKLLVLPLLVGGIAVIAFVKLVGTAFLGAPRSPEAAKVHEGEAKGSLTTTGEHWALCWEVI